MADLCAAGCSRPRRPDHELCDPCLTDWLGSLECVRAAEVEWARADVAFQDYLTRRQLERRNGPPGDRDGGEAWFQPEAAR